MAGDLMCSVVGIGCDKKPQTPDVKPATPNATPTTACDLGTILTPRGIADCMEFVLRKRAEAVRTQVALQTQAAEREPSKRSGGNHK